MEVLLAFVAYVFSAILSRGTFSVWVVADLRILTGGGIIRRHDLCLEASLPREISFLDY
jgi:hypothetical protein